MVNLIFHNLRHVDRIFMCSFNMPISLVHYYNLIRKLAVLVQGKTRPNGLLTTFLMVKYHVNFYDDSRLSRMYNMKSSIRHYTLIPIVAVMGPLQLICIIINCQNLEVSQKLIKNQSLVKLVN